jgi:hypothetical protein
VILFLFGRVFCGEERRATAGINGATNTTMVSGARSRTCAGALKRERPSHELLYKLVYLQSVFLKRDLMWGEDDQMVGIAN